jgi:hypothetical protein
MSIEDPITDAHPSPPTPLPEGEGRFEVQIANNDLHAT